MVLIIFLTAMNFIMNSETIIFNVNFSSTLSEWRTVNDVVMGGISDSKFEINDEGTATFSGVVSPDNNGGFASARASLKKEFNGFEGVILHVKGDGNIYSLRFRTDTNFDGISYQAKFKTESGNWKEYKIPLNDFKPIYRGMALSNKPKLESKNIKQIGVLIADKQFGKFKLNIDWIRFY